MLESGRLLVVLASFLVPPIAAGALPPALGNSIATTLCPEIGVPATGGCEAWVSSYDGPAGEFDTASAVALVPGSKLVVIAGVSDGLDGRWDLYARALDEATGRAVWTARFEGAPDVMETFGGLAVSPAGDRIYLAGTTRTSAGGFRDYVTWALDAQTGATLWTAWHDGARHFSDNANAIAVSRDGERVFVTGASELASQRDDFVTIAYDAASGERLWISAYSGPGTGTDEAFAIAESPNGSLVAVTGRSYGTDERWGGTGFDVATVAYDAASGAPQWVARHHRALMSRESGVGIAFTPDGALAIVAADSHDAMLSGADFVTLAYDARTGLLQWWDEFDGGIRANDRPHALAVSADGATAFVAGETTAMHDGINLETDFGVVAYDSVTGLRRWVATYHSPAGGDDFATALALAPDGARVYAAGASHGGAADLNVALLTLDATTGARAWVAVHDGPASERDAGTSIALSRDASKVIVAGGVGTGNLEVDGIAVAWRAQAGPLVEVPAVRPKP